MLAALFYLPSSTYLLLLGNAAFALRPLRVARDLGWCDHDYPRWGAHSPEAPLQLPTCAAHRLLS